MVGATSFPYPPTSAFCKAHPSNPNASCRRMRFTMGDPPPTWCSYVATQTPQAEAPLLVQQLQSEFDSEVESYSKQKRKLPGSVLG